MISRIGLAWAIGLWAIAAWGGRVAIVFDIGSAPAERLRIGVAVVTAAAAVIALVARRWERPLVLVYSGVAAVIWIRSLIVVFSDDRSPAFLVVHALLATVSLLLATVAAVSVWQRRLS